MPYLFLIISKNLYKLLKLSITSKFYSSKHIKMLKEKISIQRRSQLKMNYELNHYQKQKIIGKGTFGKVFHVINKKDRKQYALKQVIQDSKYKNRELNIIAQMQHQNIIEMKDYFFSITNHECMLHIVMDYMDSSLSCVLKEQRKRKEPIALPIRKILAFQLFKGLYYLSLNDVCHRDLKPPNILVNLQNCLLKICDFGSAKVIEIKENNVSYICSRYYRAPELILSSTTYGCQVDMWSAGCILAEFLSLEPLFPGDSSMEQLIQIIKICGTPSSKQIAKFSKENAEIDLPRLKRNDLGQILNRYKPQDAQIDLITKILTYDVQERLTPFQALTHPYFKDLLDIQECESVDDIFNFNSLKNRLNRREIRILEKLYGEAGKNKQNEGPTRDSSRKE